MPRLARPTPMEASVLALLPLGFLVLDRIVAACARAPLMSTRALLVSLGVHVMALVAAWVALALVRFVAGPSRLGHAALSGAACAAATLLMGRTLVGGVWISAQSWAPMLPWGLALAAGGAWGRWVYVAEAKRSPAKRKRRMEWAALVAPLVLVPVIDATVLPARFPAFHLWLYGAQAVLSVSLASCLGREVPLAKRWSQARRRITGLANLLAAVCVLLAWWPSDRVRAELVMSSPTLARLVRLTGPRGPSRVRPVLEAPEPDAPRTRVEGGPHLPEANVLLVTVDALRADAVWPQRRPGGHPSEAEDVAFLEAWLREGVVFRRAYAPASTTAASMPLTFQSLRVVENPKQYGTRLGPRMHATGRHTIAVANAYFGPEANSGLAWLARGFDDTRIHDNDAIDRAVPELLEGIDAAQGRPFFAWLHLFSVHEPGFAGRLLKTSDGSWPRRYRRALAWTDAELERLHRGLEERGLLDNTIVVLTSDHGEGLGDNGVPRHGATVFEEEVRVPLVFFVPGLEPRIVEAPVGTVDLVPTLLALLGESSLDHHDGRSLAPALVGVELPEADLQLVNRTLGMAGIVRGNQKLVYDYEAGTAQRFDLDRDPEEEQDLYSSESRDDVEFMHDLVRAFPQLFGSELDDDMNAALLVERLRALDDDSPRTEVNFLVGLALTHGGATFVREVERLLERSSREERRELLERRLRWGMQEPIE